ncbi:autophagy-related protein 11 [Anopheles sinensis]|uniref:Autophagy-related protein 11 n=1 Tax=Anopheles sinensis TaxID=74873 RepID=A0A084VSR2_ANOSI|nr:autophagy-related protein 11 [Anopheles sinensis]
MDTRNTSSSAGTRRSRQPERIHEGEACLRRYQLEIPRLKRGSRSRKTKRLAGRVAYIRSPERRQPEADREPPRPRVSSNPEARSIT